MIDADAQSLLKTIMANNKTTEPAIYEGEIVFDPPANQKGITADSHYQQGAEMPIILHPSQVNMALLWGGIALGLIANEALRHFYGRSLADFLDL